MKILVTGGAGFIGSNFVHYWIQNHHSDHITVLDSLTYAGDINRLQSLDKNKQFSFVQGDIQNYQLVFSLMKKVETVIHFAAETHVDRSLSGLESEKIFFRTNLEGTATLLHAAKSANIKRFHHISTDEVYGDLDNNPLNKFNEQSPYKPNNPYSISKAAADFLVMSFYRTYGLPVTISNCTNNYGPYQTPEKIIPRSISLLMAGKKIQLYTDADGVPGKNIRDWLFVEDHCRAIEAILKYGEVGETYCIGGGRELSNLELVKHILQITSQYLGKKMTVESNVEFVQDRPGHDLRYAIDFGKINKELDWSPKYSFVDGFRKTIEWYLSETGQTWLERLKKTTAEVRVNQNRKHSKR